MGLTYREAGVDVDLQDRAIAALVAQLHHRRRGKGAALRLEGGYAGLVSLGPWYLALSTDNVGTKQLLARTPRDWENLGVDCIAINVNDVLCVGAEPAALVDYIATHRYDLAVARAIGRGLDRGARMANVTVVGGEFACVPALVKDLDLSGTALGFVRRGQAVTGRAVRPGDALLGLPSSGLHANGFTLAREVLDRAGVALDDRLPGLRRRVGEELLVPTHIYVREVLPILRRRRVHGLAHISGSGLWNLLRLRPGVAMVIDDPLPVPPIFGRLQDLGSMEDREMYQTFNMGLGFVLVMSAGEAEAARRSLPGSRIVGRVERGKGVRVEPLGLAYGT